MTDRIFLDVIQWKKTAAGKDRPVKLGYAERKTYNGVTKLEVTLDCLPLPNERGFTSFTITKRQERETHRDFPIEQSETPAPPPHHDPIDDEIAF